MSRFGKIPTGVSRVRRNSPRKYLGWCQPLECLSRPRVELSSDGVELALSMDTQVSPLREVLAQESVGVLIAAPLPGAVRVAEVDFYARFDREAQVVCHLMALIPGEATTQLLGQRLYLRHQRGTNVWSGPPLGQPQKHNIAAVALDQGPDGRFQPLSKDEVSLPVTWYRPVSNLGRPLANHDHVLQNASAALACSPVTALCTSGAQVALKFLTQAASTLNVQGLVDGLVGHTHRWLVRIVQSQFRGDLLRRPALSKSVFHFLA